MCFDLIIHCVTDEWANFIVFDLPLKNEIYPHFGNRRVSKRFRLTFVKNMKSWYGYRTQGRATSGTYFHFLVKSVYFSGQGKLRSAVPGPYQKENKTIFFLKNG